jgi:hypothetical protein
MKNTTLLDASVLLATPPSRARDIFGGDASARKNLYRRLVSRWHPDHNPDPQAHEVFIHLSRLFEALDADSSQLMFSAENGRTFSFQPQAQGSFELGQWYRGKGSLVYLTDRKHRGAHEAFASKVRNLNYANADMRKQISPCLPNPHSIQMGPSGQLIVLKRDPEGIRLADLIEYLSARGEHVEPRHVAWILSSLHNLACYLGTQGIAHHGITPTNVWINPRLHRCELLGGWFHSLSFGERIRSLPSQVAQHAPRAYLDAKIASGRLDQESIRGIGRALLGDASGMRMNTSTPSALIDALRLPAHGSAIEEYRRWQQALLASFGPPKFVEMKLSYRDIYTGE